MHFNLQQIAAVVAALSLTCSVSARVASPDSGSLSLYPRSPLPPVGKGGKAVKGGKGASAAGSGAAAGGAGSSAGKSDAVLTPQELETRGVTVIDALETAIRDNPADKVPDKSLRDTYKVKDDPQTTTPDIRSQFSQSGRTGDGRNDPYLEYTIRNNGDESGNPNTIIAQYKLSQDKGVFINEVSYSSRDVLGDNRIFTSDQQFAAWTDKGGDSSRLSLLVQRNIQNDATRTLIPPSGKASYLPQSSEFKQIMGSDNGRPFARLLTDHHQAFGSKRITRIDVYGGSRPSILFIVG